MVISNNGDTQRVLATVVSTLYLFFGQYPDASVYATGSTPSRTRLYQMGINRYLKEIQEDFEIVGELTTGWETFRPNVNYLAFAIRLKR